VPHCAKQYFEILIFSVLLIEKAALCGQVAKQRVGWQQV
jgi:hypothetical protein